MTSTLDDISPTVASHFSAQFSLKDTYITVQYVIEWALLTHTCRGIIRLLHTLIMAAGFQRVCLFCYRET